MKATCDNLDAFLTGDMHATAEAAFAEHLAHCDECREEVAEQRWIDGLLQSPVRLHLEAAPERIADAVVVRIADDARVRRRWVSAAFGVAAAILIALGWIQFSRHSNDLNAVATQNENDGAPKAKPPAATFVADSNAIAVPMASRHPNVTVVRVYPAFQPRLEHQTAAMEPEADSEFISSSFSNGG